MPYCGNCGNQLSDLAVACPKCGRRTARGMSQSSGAPVLSEQYPSAPALRPLGIGEVIDAAIKVYTKNASTLFKLTAITVLPAQILSAIVLASSPSGASNPFRFTTQIGQTTPSTPNLSGIWSSLAASLLVGLLGLAATQLATAA